MLYGDLCTEEDNCVLFGVFKVLNPNHPVFFAPQITNSRVFLKNYCVFISFWLPALSGHVLQVLLLLTRMMRRLATHSPPTPSISTVCTTASCATDRYMPCTTSSGTEPTTAFSTFFFHPSPDSFPHSPPSDSPSLFPPPPAPSPLALPSTLPTVPPPWLSPRIHPTLPLARRIVLPFLSSSALPL